MSQPSSTWDLGRFVKTLSYFGAIPFLSSVEWFQQWLGSRSDPKVDGSVISYGMSVADSTDFLTDPKLGIVLVIGATSAVGERVVQQLVEQGYRVRSLFSPTERSQPPSQSQVEVVQADLADADAVSAALEGVSAIICASVGDRHPEPLKDSEPIKNLIKATSTTLSRPGQLVFDFTQPTSDLKEVWGALDDVVMGGASQSSIQLGTAGAVFSGTVSTANSGGFASVRTRNFEPPLDLSQAEGIELCVRGDGDRYKLLLRSESGWDGLAYSYSFDTIPNTQMIVRIPFAALIPVFRAKTVKDAPPFDASRVYAFQLMLSKFEYDGALNPHFSPGSFQLQVKFIKTYKASDLPQLILVSSAEVPDSEAERNLEETVHQSGISYTIIRPGMLTEEVGGRSLLFSSEPNPNSPASNSPAQSSPVGQISCADLSTVCVQALAHPQARNVTFSVTEAQGNCAPLDWDCLFAQL